MLRTDSWDCHVHEMLRILTTVILNAFKQFQQNLLWNLASSPLQIGKSGETEIRVELMSRRIKWSADR